MIGYFSKNTFLISCQRDIYDATFTGAHKYFMYSLILADIRAFQHSSMSIILRMPFKRRILAMKVSMIISVTTGIKYDKALVGKIQFLVRIKQEIIITATVERFQHVQETVDVKILLTDFLLLNHPAVVITHKLVESVEIGSDIPVFRYPADVCVHRSRKGHFFRTPWGFILTFPECEYQCLDAFTLFHVKFPGIRIERIEGDGIVLLIGDIDTVLAMCPVMNGS